MSVREGILLECEAGEEPNIVLHNTFEPTMILSETDWTYI
jgi:hypothetical protein